MKALLFIVAANSWNVWYPGRLQMSWFERKAAMVAIAILSGLIAERLFPL